MAWRNKYKLIPIVEGNGEERAVPIMLERWFNHRRFGNFSTPDLAVRAHTSSLLKAYDAAREWGIEHYLNLAMRGRPDAILVIIDADDECIERQKMPTYRPLGPELLLRAKRHMPHVPVSVVIANREFEAWFLAAYRRLKHVGHFQPEVRFPIGFEVENPRDCKGWISKCIGRKYSPTADQHVLAKAMPFGRFMSRYSRSFEKLLKDLESLTRQARINRHKRMIPHR